MTTRVALEPAKLQAAIRQVEARIGARFPGSGLAGLAASLAAIAADALARSARIRAADWRLRLVSAALLGSMALLVRLAILHAQPPPERIEAFQLAQGIDALLSAIVLCGAAVAFVVTLEVRAKRKKALEALHELRVLAHVIDLHQIAKDPERSYGADGAAAPDPGSAAQLSRYLNECSDLLALIGKVAAFYVQGFQDGVVLAAVNDIEELTNGLARKIWQKLTLLDQMVGPARA
jgi:hypothetical protein